MFKIDESIQQFLYGSLQFLGNIYFHMINKPFLVSFCVEDIIINAFEVVIVH